MWKAPQSIHPSRFSLTLSISTFSLPSLCSSPRLLFLTPSTSLPPFLLVSSFPFIHPHLFPLPLSLFHLLELLTTALTHTEPSLPDTNTLQRSKDARVNARLLPHTTHRPTRWPMQPHRLARKYGLHSKTNAHKHKAMQSLKCRRKCHTPNPLISSFL